MILRVHPPADKVRAMRGESYMLSGESGVVLDVR
jgi:hypothetical protein